MKQINLTATSGFLPIGNGLESRKVTPILEELENKGFVVAVSRDPNPAPVNVITDHIQREVVGSNVLTFTSGTVTVLIVGTPQVTLNVSGDYLTVSKKSAKV